MTSRNAFLKYNIINNLKSPFFYIIAILFSVFTSINYFIRQQFFSGNGTTDLVLFFSSVPYISILIMPSLCSKRSFQIYDKFVPLSSLEKISINFVTKLILYTSMILLLIPAALTVNMFGCIDFGQLTTSIICLFFYGCAIISLCCFVNIFFSNRLISYIVSATLLAIFNSAHLFAVYIQFPDFIVSVFKQMSFAWHFDAAGKGILDTRDIFRLSGTSVLFVLLSEIASSIKNGKCYTKKEKLNKIAAIACTLLVMMNGNKFYKRFDFSKNKTYSISKYSKELLKKADTPIKITYYRSSKIAKLYPQIRDVSDFLEEYTSAGKNITLIIKNPDKDKTAKTLLENYGITGQQMKTVSDTSTEYTTVYSSIIIEYMGYAEMIGFTMAANTLEYDIDGRIKHLISGNTRSVNIVVGNEMTLNDDYSYIVPWLQAQGFICNQISIDDPLFSDKLSKTTGPLFVIGDSRINIENAIAIESYILSNKGNAILAVSPYSSSIADSWNITQNLWTNIVEMIENWGVQFSQKIAADVSCAAITMYSEDNSHQQVINYPLWISVLQQKNATLGMTLFWPTPLELNENAQPYIMSSPASYFYEIDKNSKDKLIETNPFILETSKTSDLQKSTQILAAQIKGKISGLYNLADRSDANIIVVSDQYFVNSLMNGYIGGETGDYRNFDFMTNALLKLNNEEELAELQSRISRDTSFFKIKSIADFTRLKLISFIILFAIIPLTVIAFGFFFNFHKKKAVRK